MKPFLFLLLALAFLLPGCDETPTPASPEMAYTAIIQAVPANHQSISGRENSLNVSAQILTTEGIPAPGVRATFVVAGGDGAFVTPSVTSDNAGRVASAFEFTPAAGAYEFDLRLVFPNGTAEATLTGWAFPRPTNLTLISPTERIVLPVGQSAELNFSAMLTADGRKVTQFPMKASLQPLTGESFGLLSCPQASDDDGKFAIEFNSAGGFGLVDLIVSTDSPLLTEQLTDTVRLEVASLEGQIGSLTVRAYPNYLNLPPDSLGESMVTATVRDIDNKPISGLEVRFATDLGMIWEVAFTDSIGKAYAFWNNNYQGGTARVSASISGTEFDAATSIVVIQNLPPTGILTITTNTNTIYADNGLTVARITALLKDQDNQSIRNAPIMFTCTHGAISSPIRTNALGIVDTIFSDVGLPSTDARGNPVPAKIYAKYPQLNLIDSVEVWIRERNPVAAIALTSQKNQMTAASGDSSWIRATATLVDGSFAPRGTLIQFVIRGAGGSFTEDADLVTDFGRAETRYLAGNIVGTAVISAFVWNDNGSQTNSNEVEIQLLPGPPNRVNLQAFPTELLAGDPTAFSNITATSSDTAGNPVQMGTLVNFTTDLGSVSPTAFTDDNGRAIARFMPDGRTGVATITGSVRLPGGVVIQNQTTVALIGGRPNTIQISADPPEIAARGTGGNSNSLMTARVVDSYGNSIGIRAPVIFQILGQGVPPEGASLPNGTSIDSSFTSQGVAHISVTAGQIPGPIEMRIYTWSDPDTVWDDERHLNFHTRTDTVEARGRWIEVTGDPLPVVPVRSIDLTSQMAQMEAGSGQHSLLRAIATTANGGFAAPGTIVHFSVDDGNGSFTAEVDLVEAFGRSEVEYIAGLNPGIAVLRAWVFNAPGDTAFSNPVEIELLIDGAPDRIGIEFNADGDDAGGGAWQIPVKARLFDREGRPVADNIPVGFTVIPEDAATIIPGFTGNDIGRGSERGAASTWLRYHSLKTFDEVTIRAEVQTENGVVTAEIPCVLPLQDGALELNVDPQNWMFDRGRPNDSCNVRVWVVLTDGHQIPISGAPILFRTDRMRFSWRDRADGGYHQFFPDPVRMFTGRNDEHHNESPGQATVYLRGIPQWDLEWTLEVTVHVEASVEGYDVAADPGFIFMTRH